jgi:hypothetical protein
MKNREITTMPKENRQIASRHRSYLGFLFGTLLVYSIIVSSLSLTRSSSRQADVTSTLPPPSRPNNMVRRKLSAKHDTIKQEPLGVTVNPENTIHIVEAQSLATDASNEFSSCLMVMDDNHRLIEWIAYHYFVMNLRYLVILPDPRSEVFPKPILDRWRKYMTIVEWSDDDYFNDKERRKAEQYHKTPDAKSLAQQYHNMRQDGFLRSCTKHMRDHDRNWVSFHDVDEYWVLNSNTVNGAHERMAQPGSVLTFIKEIQGLLEPLMEELGVTVSDRYVGPCISTYRTLYGAVESTKEERDKNVPEFLDSRRFDTLRWRQHRKHNKPQLGKSLIDLTRITERDLQNNDEKYSPHQTLTLCPPIFYTKVAFLNLNHYFGNWESYSFRPNDGRAGARKTRKSWEDQSQQTGGKSGDDIRPWIGAFVQHFGKDEANRLLDGVGLDPNYKAPITEKWLPTKDIKKGKMEKNSKKYTDAKDPKETEHVEAQ